VGIIGFELCNRRAELGIKIELERSLSGASKVNECGCRLRCYNTGTSRYDAPFQNDRNDGLRVPRYGSAMALSAGAPIFGACPGRICVAALNSKNIEYVADAIATVLETVPVR